MNGGTLGAGNYLSINDNTWYFVAVTWDGSIAKFYVNNNLISSHPLSGQMVPDSKNLAIGIDPPGEVEYFKGKIDDLRIYSRALSAEELFAIFNQ